MGRLGMTEEILLSVPMNHMILSLVMGNNYMADIKLGAYVDITDMIPEQMKEFNELMPENILGCSKSR